MSTKSAVIATVVWVIACMVVGFGVMVFVLKRPDPEKAKPFGTATGIVASAGTLPIWIGWLVARRRERSERARSRIVR